MPSAERIPVTFHTEDTDLELPDTEQIRSWLQRTGEEEGCYLGPVNIIFCSDAYLHRMNLSYLDHDTLTDIITFDYSEGNELSGDLFISVDRVRENAAQFQTPFGKELSRVMVHGLLHLAGYADDTDAEKEVMRKKEEFYIDRLASTS